MTMGPAPMIMIERMSVLFGIGSPCGTNGVRRANCRRYRHGVTGRKGGKGVRGPTLRRRVAAVVSARGDG
jgi:hypothetical protein